MIQADQGQVEVPEEGSSYFGYRPGKPRET
jgi:hypothetical protein